MTLNSVLLVVGIVVACAAWRLAWWFCNSWIELQAHFWQHKHCERCGCVLSLRRVGIFYGSPSHPICEACDARID